jgi:hypothetical protein
LVGFDIPCHVPLGVPVHSHICMYITLALSGLGN